MTDWNEHEDAISDAISDSIDMDWTSRTGAKAVVAWLNENAAAPAPSSLAGGEKHYGDPCIRCGVGHDNVPPGPCQGDGITISRERARAVLDYLKNGRGPAGWPTQLWVEVQHFIANIEAALSPEAPAREVTDTMVEAACSRFVSESDDIWSASVWPEGLDDDGDRGDGGRVRQISEDDQHKIRAAMRFALQDALTPRHEAPAEGAGEPWDYAVRYLPGNVEDYGLLSGYPADLAKTLHTNPLYEVLPLYLRARSSAPEAREGGIRKILRKQAADPKRYLNPTHAIADNVFVDHDPEARFISDNYSDTHPAAPSADKLRIAVEALEPFVAEAERIRAPYSAETIMNNVELWQFGSVEITRTRLTYGDLRRAHKALAVLKAEGC